MTVCPESITLVLFDLDGTLADTAPDLAACVNRLRSEQGLAPMACATLRPLAGAGARALLEAGLPELDRDARERLLPRYLSLYRAHCWELSRPYPGIDQCLKALECTGRRWGVVTNKTEALAVELLSRARWLERAACVIGGDTAARPKPAPDPVLEACTRVGVEPGRTMMIGDDPRDIEAARAGGAWTAVAGWGDLTPGSDPAAWGADCYFGDPLAVVKWLNSN
ncbi:MAG: N-acetylmuramic acid 6-phosphate phosphatase MupP [Wenzhouxiangellaceae bacterium]